MRGFFLYLFPWEFSREGVLVILGRSSDLAMSVCRTEPFSPDMPPQDSPYAGWFKAEVLPHEDLLRSWLQGRFGGYCDVDDVVQEAYARLLRAKMRGSVKSPKALLFTTARNVALDVLRRRKIVQIDVLADDELSDVIDDSEAVEERFARDQELEILTEAIQSLPDRCRQIFTLRKVYGLSQPEIAKELGVSVHTVSAQLTIGVHKCGQFMRDRLGAERR